MVITNAKRASLTLIKMGVLSIRNQRCESIPTERQQMGDISHGTVKKDQRNRKY